MKSNWKVENQCYAFEGFLKVVKVYNYDGLNEVVNVCSADFEFRNSNQLVGVWKIKKLKV